MRAPLIAIILSTSLPFAVQGQMMHPSGMSHQQVVAAASAGAPDYVAQNASAGWIDSAGAYHEMRPGSNGFTCATIIPDPIGGPICGDRVAMAWVAAMLTGAANPPVATAPGIAYMAHGGSHYEDAQGNVLMEHDRSPHAAGSHRVVEQAHWMLIWPMDPAATGLPAKENGTGSYIMFAGTPYAHVMIYQDPNQMHAAPMHH